MSRLHARIGAIPQRVDEALLGKAEPVGRGVEGPVPEAGPWEATMPTLHSAQGLVAMKSSKTEHPNSSPRVYRAVKSIFIRGFTLIDLRW